VIRRLTCISGLALVMLLPGARAAEAINLTPLSPAVATTGFNSTIDTAAEWFTYLGISPEPFLLYKSDVSGTSGLGNDSGPYASSYKTVFSATPDDPSAALITYMGGSTIGCGTCYLLIKDGNSATAQYLFSLLNWNGTEEIKLTGFWPQQGAISNVGIYSAGPTIVPEPATLSMLVMGMLGLGARRRRPHSAA
jgi:hypothetical protein